MDPRSELYALHFKNAKQRILLELDNLCANGQANFDELKLICLTIASKLYLHFKAHKNSFPNKKVLNIASLNCWDPHEYFAFKAFYAEFFPDCQLKFFALTNQSAENNALNQMLYSNYPSIRYVYCDPFDEKSITNAVRVYGRFRQGFDLVILRDAEFSSQDYTAYYLRAFANVIPAIATTDARIIFTFNGDDCESQLRLQRLLVEPYKSVITQSLELPSSPSDQFESDGKIFDMDVLCTFLKCEGQALRAAINPLNKFRFFTPLGNISKDTGEFRLQLFQEINSLNSEQNVPASVTHALLRMFMMNKYYQALCELCHLGLVEQVKVMLQYSDIFKINVRLPEPVSGKTPYEICIASSSSPEIKSALLDVILSEHEDLAAHEEHQLHSSFDFARPKRKLAP